MQINIENRVLISPSIIAADLSMMGSIVEKFDAQNG